MSAFLWNSWAEMCSGFQWGRFHSSEGKFSCGEERTRLTLFGWKSSRHKNTAGRRTSTLMSPASLKVSLHLLSNGYRSTSKLEGNTMPPSSFKAWTLHTWQTLSSLVISACLSWFDIISVKQSAPSSRPALWLHHILYVKNSIHPFRAWKLKP